MPKPRLVTPLNHLSKVLVAIVDHSSIPTSNIPTRKETNATPKNVKRKKKDKGHTPKLPSTQPFTMYKETTGLPPGSPFRLGSQPTSLMVFFISSLLSPRNIRPLYQRPLPPW